MRWDKLFDDLESQLERELTAEELDLGAEEERLRLSRLTMRERLDAAPGAVLALTLVDGTRLAARVVTVGRDWLSADVVDDSTARRQAIIPIAAIASVVVPREIVAASLAVRQEPHPALTARLGLAFVLRDLCRRRRAVGLSVSGATLHGTIDRVGRDHFDLAIHEPGSARRESEVAEIRMVALAAVLTVLL